MLFNSLEFLFFFPIVTVLYFLLPHKYRWFHLLVASCVFYMAFIPIYILILFFTIIIDYIAGILIETAEGKRKKLFLVMSIVANVGVLAVFKYYNFFIENVSSLIPSANITSYLPILSIILPIGLSFHTFQAMSYTIEVYRGKQKAEKHLGIYALYVMFYPQLVAGPIERPQNLLGQFRTPHFFDSQMAISGLRLIMWGLFKKVVIADNLSGFVNKVYSQPENFSGLPLIVGTIFFTIQIYCDFSGYSDVAIGSARVMGFKLMRNFNIPYYSRSISEFWRRWHISLSTWFKDYVYIPLGGNKVSGFKHSFNLFFVFLISGFWHGANWTYVLWGALHGTYLFIGNLTTSFKTKLHSLLGIHKFQKPLVVLNVLLVFCLVSFAWIFFRANNVNDAMYIASHLFNKSYAYGDTYNATGISSILIFFSKIQLLYIFSVIAIMEFVHYCQYKNILNIFLVKMPTFVRWGMYYTIIALIIINGQSAKQQFIYFQF